MKNYFGPLSGSVLFFVVFFFLFQIKGTHFSIPASDFCLSKVGPFCIVVKWKVNYCHCYFYLHLLNMSDFFCYNVIIKNNYCIFYGYFSWRWNEITEWMNELKKKMTATLRNFANVSNTILFSGWSEVANP